MSTSLIPPLYHVTQRDTALEILAHGFRDATGSFGFHYEAGAPLQRAGVWLAEQPVNETDSLLSDTVVEVTLDVPEAELSRFEWMEDSKGYREWLIPAALVNDSCTLRLLERRVDESSLRSSLDARRDWLDQQVRTGRKSEEWAEWSLRQYEAAMRRWQPE